MAHAKLAKRIRALCRLCSAHSFGLVVGFNFAARAVSFVCDCILEMRLLLALIVC